MAAIFYFIENLPCLIYFKQGQYLKLRQHNVQRAIYYYQCNINIHWWYVIEQYLYIASVKESSSMLWSSSIRFYKIHPLFHKYTIQYRTGCCFCTRILVLCTLFLNVQSHFTRYNISSGAGFMVVISGENPPASSLHPYSDGGGIFELATVSLNQTIR